MEPTSEKTRDALRGVASQLVRRGRLKLSGSLPVTIEDAASAEDFGAGLSALQQAVRAEGVSNGQIATAVMDGLGVEDWQAWRVAAHSVARQADRMGQANAYHDSRHMSDVTLAAVNLMHAHNRSAAGQAMPFDQDDIAMMTVLALGHDLHHDGKGNRGRPFHLERQSAEIVMRACYGAMSTDHEGLKDMRAAIMATDAVSGYAVLRALEQNGGTLPKTGLDPVAEKALQEEPVLRRLENPKLRQMAYILRDADLFCSLVDPATVDRQNRDMAIESFGGADKATPEGYAFFYSNIAGGRFLSEAAQPLNALAREVANDNAFRISVGDPKMTLAQARAERRGPAAPARRPAPTLKS